MYTHSERFYLWADGKAFFPLTMTVNILISNGGGRILISVSHSAHPSPSDGCLQQLVTGGRAMRERGEGGRCDVLIEWHCTV